MIDVVLESMRDEWSRVRPNEDARQLATILNNDSYRVLAQIAFEAGRRWQVEHPNARLGVPDYDCPQTFEAPEYYEPGIDLSNIRNALRDLVTRCDGKEGVRADGSNIDTLAAHAALGDLEEVLE